MFFWGRLHIDYAILDIQFLRLYSFKSLCSQLEKHLLGLLSGFSKYLSIGAKVSRTIGRHECKTMVQVKWFNINIFVSYPQFIGNNLAVSSPGVDSNIRLFPYDADRSIVFNHHSCGTCSPCVIPLMAPCKGHAVHLAIGKPLGAWRVPLLIPAYRLFAGLYALLEAISIWKSMLALVFRKLRCITPIIAIVLQRNLRWVKSQLSSHVIEYQSEAQSVWELLTSTPPGRPFTHVHC